jgi:hypothetical protein
MTVAFKLGGVMEIPIMWMDIVIKSPGMNSPENKAFFKKAALGLRITAVAVGLIIIAFMAIGQATFAAYFFILVLIFSIVLYMKSSRALAVMICKDFWELGYNPGEDKFKGAAEKSGHNAAKNIVLVANNFSKIAAVFVLSLMVLGVTVKNYDLGLVPFIAACSFLCCNASIQAVFRGYVRLGARKKLAAAGFSSDSKVSAATTVTATSNTSSSSSEGL